VFPRSTRLLCDEILAEARARGVRLEQESLTLELDLPVLRLRLADRVLHGTRIRLPGAPGSSAYTPDVVTVHGSGFKASRMWPRRLDGSFRVGAIVDHLLMLAEEELGRCSPELHVAAGVPATASGLHTIHAAAIRVETMAPGTSPGSLVALVGDEARRATIEARLVREGLRDADLRVLSEAAGLFLGRATKLGDFDPFEPISDRILTMLRVGATHAGQVQRRFVLLLDRRGDGITIADPGGQGLVTMTRRTLAAAWKNGTSKGALWLGTLGRHERART
jgi:hypothetical protein